LAEGAKRDGPSPPQLVYSLNSSPEKGKGSINQKGRPKDSLSDSDYARPESCGLGEIVDSGADQAEPVNSPRRPAIINVLGHIQILPNLSPNKKSAQADFSVSPDQRE